MLRSIRVVGTMALALLIVPGTAPAESKQACVSGARAAFRAAKKAAREQFRAVKSECQGTRGGGGGGATGGSCFEVICSGEQDLQICDQFEDGDDAEGECARISGANGPRCKCRVVEHARCSTGDSLAPGGRCLSR